MAVSTVLAKNGEPEGFQEMLVLYCDPVVEVTGVPPVAGIVIPVIAVFVIGAFGVVMEADGLEALPVPTELDAVTVNV